jgi:hypothetical protein
MDHQHLHTPALEKTVKRMDEAQRMIVAIACYTDKRLECCDFLSQLHASSEISCMPYLIHRLEEFPELRVKHSVRI